MFAVGIESKPASELVGAADSQDPEAGLAAVAALRALLEVLEELQVANARAQGWSWQAIAKRLGVSKQAVHHKYAVERIPGRRRS